MRIVAFLQKCCYKWRLIRKCLNLDATNLIIFILKKQRKTPQKLQFFRFVFIFWKNNTAKLRKFATKKTFQEGFSIKWGDTF